jgi:hypothetical protein
VSSLRSDKDRSGKVDDSSVPRLSSRAYGYVIQKALQLRERSGFLC